MIQHSGMAHKGFSRQAAQKIRSLAKGRQGRDRLVNAASGVEAGVGDAAHRRPGLLSTQRVHAGLLAHARSVAFHVQQIVHDLKRQAQALAVAPSSLVAPASVSPAVNGSESKSAV